MRDDNQPLKQSVDYEAAREKVLKKLKMGRQSAAGKAIDAFIKQMSTQGVKNSLTNARDRKVP